MDAGNLLNLKNQALAVISEAETKKELSELKVKFLGRKGEVNQLLKNLSDLDPDQKAQTGRLLNEAKTAITQALRQKTLKLSPAPRDWLDVTAPGKTFPSGHLHPITQAIEEVSRIFERLGFTRVRYPEVDWDWYVFEALNMPEDHPARDEWETIFIDAEENKKMGKMVLTTHTSNGQVREMERAGKTLPGKTPIRMLNIGKCYRRQQDRTHTVMFHQFEGLVVDRHIGIPDLKGTLNHFAREFYGPKARSRIRPFNFRFTEPSFEVDFSCVHCLGRGCRFCKSGWHEVGGAGLVHPNVLKAGGLNPKVYSGFAFGWGIERCYTLKPGLNLDDIRLLYSSNLEFLNQF
ncbi:MAG: Phenylalanine-tRNA ligase alpha subunit [Candidatus Beckwithbacteria bacterium GW2011_GWB1_47_15]|uniref:Phenylalanine--tRNA ligase alpha subunit n=1 Tax=Candidatus Beckwithbacteria bacterium GW2011_GWB1_47_15 TaxID=1618371 RepID=A0A0G1UUF8_9BACT|nr:MAG: phenylalanyl-tRNA synthetase subunit alpha, phenylalanyl-tRNA synthetase alpha chain [Candidatus Beckwithbacteria bacterium GW2011_GWC1_49_16]KKU34931.1 MAG: Phenylalanine-tRNA ligase alpha subunit [Candidatus Beckwithbacteria bacterium GW2011_GWA1_46_30]KKU61360.1 MAG: Phenylalanine-tRNA ligase alpha subunit [Candidatus Beckwithbacteria bacterium GW2011_GWB1_47_15]KKU71369.1 MAG: Phenylalanine-tRNA ligase alpha subunit [Candidatus Beckwithbacteria bacterium GW2011_GWA2_47_25]OGD48715.1